LLDRLEDRALVKRVRDARDRRMVTAAITDAGLQLLRRLDGAVGRVHREQLAHIPRRQLETLRALAEEIRRPEP
jgi:DNA-binding MarR family transcriptional regulator